MTTFLNIVLLILGASATLAAFMGKTVDEGTDPFISRINTRGWVSLACLFLALAVGVFKEIRTAQETVKAAAEAKDARDESERQGLLNLLTVLGNSEQRVADVQFVIPFTDKGTEAATIQGSFLPTFTVPACGKQTQIEIGTWLGKGGSNSNVYTADDHEDRHKHLDESPQTADALLHPDDTDATNILYKLRMSIGQNTSNGQAYALDVHVLDESESVVHFLYPSLPAGYFPIGIRAHTPQPTIVGDDLNEKPNPEYSPKCDEEVEKYFRGAFDRAYVGIALSNNHDIIIFYRLKVADIRKSAFGWDVGFGTEPGINSRPWVSPSDDVESLLNFDWTNKPAVKAATH